MGISGGFFSGLGDFGVAVDAVGSGICIGFRREIHAAEERGDIMAVVGPEEEVRVRGKQRSTNVEIRASNQSIGFFACHVTGYPGFLKVD